MDIGLYRDEQFSFSPTSYLGMYSSGSRINYNIEENELFEDFRPSLELPNDLFECQDDTERELNSDTDMLDQLNICNGQDISPPTQEQLDLLGLKWQPLWEPANLRMDNFPAETNYMAEETQIIANNKNIDNFQEISELPQLVNNVLNVPQHNLENIKIECPESALSENNKRSRRESESSDLLNESFSSTELINFDITEYVFDEKKQTKNSKVSQIKAESSQIKQEPGLEKDNVNNNQVVAPNISKRTVKAGVKKIDLKARKYIVDSDVKKSFSDDEFDIDIETVSEEENSLILEAGNLTDLLEQFEATEVKNKEHITSHSKHVKSNQTNVSLNVKVKIKEEKDENKNKIKPTITVESTNETKPNEIKLKTVTKSTLGSSHKVHSKPAIETNHTRPLKSKELLYINNCKVNSRSVNKVQETTTFSKTSNVSSNRQILDSLPEELINRIKESGKRKPITVIQPIPNNRKKSRIQEPVKTVPSVVIKNIYLDHNYCSKSNKPSIQIKKDSGFASSEEDERAIITRQPTVKNADGTLMVSLLKANTIRQLDLMKNEKKKLNLEEYKKRRSGVLTSKNNSENCSPNTSTCNSPSSEDEHQKMLKHQEKLKKMAQEVLSAAPKVEKKLDIKSQLPFNVPTLFPFSPASSNKSLSQPGSPAICKDLPIKTELSIKVEMPTNATNPIPIKSNIFEDVPIKIEPPKVPANLERKVLVSFGVNTDFKIAKNEDPLAPVEKLEEIKPLLQKASNRISENSLIASVIENIPKVLSKNEKPDKVDTIVKGEVHEHGEYKQVIYLEKDRVRCETKVAATQTNISLIEQTKRGRIRRRLPSSSSSSCSSYKSRNSSIRRSRKNSDSSLSSRSSTSSSRSEYSSRNSSRLSYSRSRSRSPRFKINRRNGSAEREHLNAVEERRIIYVGKIATTTTKEDLRRKFQKFGIINKISLHFRDIGENYGFVTFKYKEDAHEAYERGNDDTSFPCYKISFGGRREFCKTAYSDLDNMRDDSYYQSQASGDSYDKLLKEALEKLKKRKA